MAIATERLADYVGRCDCGNRIEAGSEVETQGETMIEVLCPLCGQGMGTAFAADEWEEMFED